MFEVCESIVSQSFAIRMEENLLVKLVTHTDI